MTDSSKPVLLAVLAHPDDESFGIGGTLAAYARQGVEVHLACATKGEAGTVEPEHMKGYATIEDLRVGELRCAAGILGLAGVHYLGFRDSGMPGSLDNSHPNALIAQPVERVAAQVVRLIRELKPQVVITFDPIGGYRHPDHIYIHQVTNLAFQQAGDPTCCPESLPAYAPAKLYYQTISKNFLRLVVRILRLVGQDPRRYGRNHDIDLVSLAAESFPIHAEVDFTHVAKVRAEAAACHASQGGVGMSRGFQGWLLNFFRQKELYMRAYPPPRPGERKEHDLFAGIP